jgi:hypothetical protein
LKEYDGNNYEVMKVRSRSTQYYIEKKCEECLTAHSEQSIILCDRCDDAYHIHCIVQV